jgi:hypothetical protein
VAHTPDRNYFKLDDIHRSARALLEANPNGIVAYRLLREVLRVPADDSELVRAKNAALNGGLVHQLEQAQLPDGSWGRFHSQDTKKKTVFRTTEEAIDRAFALGIEPNEGVLARVRQYTLELLCGDADLTDWTEKNEAFPLLIKYIVAGRLAQIDPTSKILESFWTYMADIANQAFSSGNYRLDDEENAYLQLFGIHVPGGFLESQHALWILSSRNLPKQLDQALVKWIWGKSDGMRYLRASLPEPKTYRIAYWLRSMNIISRFDSWQEVSTDTLNHLWGLRDEEGRWDFGSKIARSVDFPLSETWRRSTKRRMDYSTCMLVLLRKYFD